MPTALLESVPGMKYATTPPMVPTIKTPTRRMGKIFLVRLQVSIPHLLTSSRV